MIKRLELNFNYLKITTILLISIFNIACIHQIEDIKIVSWDTGSISLRHLHKLNISHLNIRQGKNDLRVALLKHSYKTIFIAIAKKQKGQYSQNFLDEYAVKRGNILYNALLKQQLKNDTPITDSTIQQYFYQHIDEYTASDKYSIYIHYIDCVDEDDCQSKLNQQLKHKTFKQLSINNETKPSGYFQDISLSRLNSKFQSQLKLISIKQISQPLKLTGEGSIFFMISQIKAAPKPKFSAFKSSVKQTLAISQNKRIKQQLMDTIVSADPGLSDKTQNQVFVIYAKKTGIDKDPKVINQLKNSYDWLLADYGYYASHFFQSLDIKKLRKELSYSQKTIDRLSRFDIKSISKEIFKGNQSQIIVLSKLLEKNDDSLIEDEIISHTQITKKEFMKNFKQLHINPVKAELNKWIGPTILGNKAIWIKKNYQGLALSDADFIDDYKKSKRHSIGGYEGFMQGIGNSMGFKINPIIYSAEWPGIAEKIIKRKQKYNN